MRKEPKGFKFPEYYGWSAWMAPKPGESAVQTVHRQITWDTIVEGEIFYADVAQW